MTVSTLSAVTMFLVACSSPPASETTAVVATTTDLTSVPTSIATPTSVSTTETTVAVTEVALEGFVFEIEGDIARAPTSVTSGLAEVTFINRGESSHGAFTSDGSIRHGIFLAPGQLADGIVEFDFGSEYTFEALLPPFSGGEDSFSVSDQVSDTAAPVSDVVVGLAEFAFSMPDRVPSDSHWWILTNNGEQNHDIGIYSLEGRTLGQLIEEIDFVDPWEHQTAVPTWVVGPQETVFANIELAAGTYGLVCRVPDDASSRRHYSLGMVLEITVEE
jgi:plastocyanin